MQIQMQKITKLKGLRKNSDKMKPRNCCQNKNKINLTSKKSIKHALLFPSHYGKYKRGHAIIIQLAILFQTN